MNQIEVKILNPDAVSEAERLMVAMARLTQSGHKIGSMDDFTDLLNKPYSSNTVAVMSSLPHPTIQKFGVLNVMVVGASRRFLAQITRHQNEVKFMSASLQYSNYTDSARFVIPYELLKPSKAKERELFEAGCKSSMEIYSILNANGVDNDSCGYLAPQALRGALLISATPYQWKHMISQRVCRRNTDETRFVLLKIWEQLFNLSPAMFSPKTTGSFCQKGTCQEGKMSCNQPYTELLLPDVILGLDFPLALGGTANEN